MNGTRFLLIHQWLWQLLTELSPFNYYRGWGQSYRKREAINQNNTCWKPPWNETYCLESVVHLSKAMNIKALGVNTKQLRWFYATKRGGYRGKPKPELPQHLSGSFERQNPAMDGWRVKKEREVGIVLEDIPSRVLNIVNPPAMKWNDYDIISVPIVVVMFGINGKRIGQNNCRDRTK
jgi:hypothetical protein